MKKLFYSLSIALAFGFCANAAVPASSLQNAMPAAKASKVSTAAIDLSKIDIVKATSYDRLTPFVKKDKKKVSAEDFYGLFKWEGTNLLEAEVLPNSGILSIGPSSEYADSISITGFADSKILNAYFDEDSQTLVVPAQYMWYAENYYTDAWFWNATMKNGVNDQGDPAYGVVLHSPIDFYFTLNEDGQLRSGNVDADKWNDNDYTDEELIRDVCIAFSGMPKDNSGYFWACWNVRGEDYPTFEFVEDEWEEIGEAQFKDAWFPYFWENNNTPPAYAVPLYADKNQPGRYLLLNPYGEDTPYGLEEINIYYDIPGYIVFNLEDFRCVTVEPLVYSMTINLVATGDAFIPTPLYCFNMEGMMHDLQGVTLAELKQLSFTQGVQLSIFNETSSQVIINNAQFSLESDILIGLDWGPEYPNTGYITLPSNWMDGVDSVLGEENNAPVEYYNLQGVRVLNPAKGQIVIARQGNKATKLVVR